MKSKNLFNRLFDQIVCLVPCLVLLVLAFIIGKIVVEGASQLSWDFFLTEPRQSGRAGGISTILVSTALILAVCMLVALPLGLASAVFLSEYGTRHARCNWLVRTSLDALAGVPSVVFGLFGNAFFCKVLGFGFSILSGGLTLACMVLPLLIRSTEEGLRAVPANYRLSAASLGMSRVATLIHLVLPAAVPGLVVGIVLGVGRALAETAALIFTSGYVDRMPSSLLDSGRALALHIFDLAINVAGGDAKAYASSLTLVLALLLINASASWLSHRFLQERSWAG